MILLFPDGDGDLTQWTAVPAGASYATVLDLNGADDDVSYLKATGGSAVTLLEFQKAPPILPIVRVLWVGVQGRFRQASSGQALKGVNVQAQIRSNGIDVLLPQLSAGSPTYQDSDPVASGWQQFTDPATGLPWTPQAALLAQVGIVYAGAGNEIRCTLLRKAMDVVLRQRNAVRGPLGDERH